MKKVKKVLIVVLIFVVVLNINYLGMVNKRIIVGSKEYKEGNNNLVLNKILSDNELKQEIPHMFNYTSEGIQDSGGDVNLDYVTNGLYSNSDEDGITYYYRGNINNNNLVFGAYDEDYYVYGNVLGTGLNYYQSKESCIEAGNSDDFCVKTKLASAGDKMYWKIVRVNGDGSLRLFYNGGGFIAADHINCGNPSSLNLAEFSGAVGNVLYNLENNDSKYSGYTYDNGTDSFIKKEVDTWYNNTLGSNSNYDSKVILGRFCSDSSGYNYDGMGHFSGYDRLGQTFSEFDKDNAPTFICPSTSESYGGSYRLKAGLITADELAFSGAAYTVPENSYLSLGEDGLSYWSMTPHNYFTNISASFVQDRYGLLGSDLSSQSVRPVINLTTENCTLIGDGTLDNPYMLEEVEPTNSYKGKVTIEVGSSIDDIKAFEDNLDLSGVTWTVKDSSVARIENGKIIGLKNGTTVITGVGSDGTSYEIEVTVISNPVTNSAIYIGICLILILVLGTSVYITYRIRNVIK